MPIPDVLGWRWPAAWEECRAQGVIAVALPTHDPRGGALQLSIPPGADADAAWRVIRMRPAAGTDAAEVELVVCAEEWQPGKLARQQR